MLKTWQSYLTKLIYIKKILKTRIKENIWFMSIKSTVKKQVVFVANLKISDNKVLWT